MAFVYRVAQKGDPASLPGTSSRNLVKPVLRYCVILTHVVPPRDLVGRRVCLDGAGEVDVVALLQVLRVHHSSQGKLHVWHN